MTDYGPGHGNGWQPEPWHPDDPLFGDQGWDGGQQQHQQQQHPQQHQQTEGWDPYAQQQGWSNGPEPQGYPAGQEQQGYPAQQYPQAQVPQQGYPDPGYPQGYPAAPDPYLDGTGQQQWQGGQGYPDQTYGWDVQAQQPQPGYDTGQFTTGYGQGYGNDVYAPDGYGGDPYGNNAYATGQFTAYDTGTATGWDTAAGYDQTAAPPVQAPAPVPEQRTPPAATAPPAPPVPRKPVEAVPDEDWNPFGEEDAEENHPFFTRGSDADDADEEYERRRPRDDDDDDDDRPRAAKGRTKGKGGKGKDKRGGTKRRSGCACLAVVVVLGGGVAGGGYAAYTYYRNHIMPPPDWAGTGTGTVQVSVPDSSTLARIGNILKQQGVVRSVDAFTKAAGDNPKAAGIQGGIYLLHRHMSAADAVAMMLDPTAQSAVIIHEGWRAVQIYAALDKQLGLKSGSTLATAKATNLGLPSWYHGKNAEGFLFPSKYSAAKGSKAGAILQQMVQRADAEFTADGLTAQAARIGKSPYQILVIASLIQAEAQQPQDFGKVSRVIYNRLQQNMALGFDSTINYAKGRSTLDTTDADTQYASPYNTYLHKGLPPGPIDNPGHEAIEAALHPTAGQWLYFVTVKPGDTRFAVTAAQHQHNVDLFNEYQREHGG
ncbi:endolytic transglycosylase MltG [Streptantibioticus silvisoli]|uniref:Endolytic murein transglycosylase n=1 Tax=Streptantibioticus silvisoli TaxID=2705255 RepID=A0ABT6W586_9ACTN|nr:endolytic transglycosylase MltG [Streptantibioticus silvisoli]MDI5964686.1 endolytic transglycosylase MltG [Streptantibioticus silvisoli]